jgi:phage terminase small subunit
MGEARGNGEEAIRLSDYQCTTKYSIHQTYAELMNHPLVKAEIERRQARREQESGVKAEYLISKLLSIIEDTQKDNPQAALRAIELAGKSIAMWKERQEITGADGGAIRHEQEVKESVADFTSRISSLVERSGANNVVELPKRSGTGGT